MLYGGHFLRQNQHNLHRFTCCGATRKKAFFPQRLLLKKNHSVDWDDLIRGWGMQRLYNYGLRINELDRRLDNVLPALGVWNMVSNRLISRAIDLFAPHEAIITNRLHGMILSALLERKAVVFDNSYGKISSYADLWMKNVAGISFKKT
jgi:exopolysaccharide biosynthesis predicted pyruvyltransferase EpsI